MLPPMGAAAAAPGGGHPRDGGDASCMARYLSRESIKAEHVVELTQSVRWGRLLVRVFVGAAWWLPKVWLEPRWAAQVAEAFPAARFTHVTRNHIPPPGQAGADWWHAGMPELHWT